MDRAIPDSTMSNLSEFLKREIGLVYPKDRWGELERRMASAARQFGFHDTGECIRWLMSAPLSRPQIEALAAFLTVGETYFYRDPRILEITEREILPEILRSRRGKDQRLRIWSAGCSSGEEPYSLAVLVHRLLPDIKDWNITILATDINRAALQKGMSGVYGKWSFRSTPSWFKNRYFTPETGDNFKIVEQVRRLVCFEYLNLAEDSYPSLPTNTNAMDLIFCRNVLMYFDTATAQQVVGKLQRCLVNGGWLIVAAAETTPRGYPGYHPVTLEGATCYRKESGAEHQPLPRPQLQPVAEAESPLETELPSEKREERPAPEAPSATGPSPYQNALDLYRQGLYQQTAALLTALRLEGGLPPEAQTLLIRSEANQGRLSEALEACDDALAAHKLDPGLHYLRAEILQEKGMNAEAQLALQRALYLDPGMVLGHFSLANLTLWGGRVERARRHFQNALDLLEGVPGDEILPGSEGMTAGRLREIIRSMTGDERKMERGRS